MSSNIFKTCLNYIYTGEILLKDYDDNESIFDLVIGADILSLTYMVDYLQNYFIKKKSFWIERNLIRIYQISLKNQNFQVLLSYCEKLIKQEPTLLFDAENLITLEKENLINIIKWDDLPLREVKIWCGLVKWIVGQKPPMNKVISNWNDSDFKEFERRIKDFIPYIRFFSIASDEYSDDVRSFRRILPKNLVEKLEVFYLKKTPPPYDELPPPRGSRDGMERDVFHSLCDNKGPTIVLAIVDQTNDIIGGYNPSSWTGSNEWVETTESFIFSFRSGNGFDDIVLSRIINPMAAIWDGDDRFDIGFSSDLQLFNGEYKHENYENRIINYENFKITNYEVFQVKNKKYSSF
ncbi:BTB/POZ protein [Rhizophagus clarus]|uniref:BTB/POZ protein n=1 Tax=Rhizophagus clarus TaxID=94130 RepID=A0A8H3MA38_9GLOM|nr:BTB/POZ protein [Rhizophagus clarus]